MHTPDALASASAARLGSEMAERDSAVSAPAAPPSAESRPSRARRPSAAVRYLVAFTAVAVVTLLRLPLQPLLGNSVPFILYFPAVMVAGWFGGFGPGLFATVLSGYVAKTWLFEPYGHFEIGDWGSAFRLLLFLSSGILMSYLCGRLHDHTVELENERDRLEENVRERTVHLQRALSDMEAFSFTVSHDDAHDSRLFGGSPR